MKTATKSQTQTQTMLAVTQRTLGGPDVLELSTTARPEPGPAEVLVRIHAASVNPTDVWHRATGGLAGADAPPVPLGWDLSGTVEAVGIGVTLFEPGDEVFGMPRHPAPAGTHAEYATSPARHLVHKPAGLTHTEAAALPLAALTAWQALVDTAGIRPGMRVLVHAAAGGVGHLAVQIAKARGAHVTGTASAAKHGFLRDLGAHEVVDYRTTDFETAATGIDIVLDTIGGEYGPRSLRTLRPGGIVVSLASPAEAALAEEARALGVRAAFMAVEADRAGMLAVAELAASGALRPHVATVLPLSRVAEAHELSASGRTSGKIVLTTDADAADHRSPRA
ncbi:NADP-dependent oxidoreductase [Streptomyces sp. NPDC012888]|uniref:NADP-dependent oxidoreductase n=1 Tax=Streptomyces sp. NPDC012888 TaxID=3364855 RepID=UPI0036894548